VLKTLLKDDTKEGPKDLEKGDMGKVTDVNDQITFETPKGVYKINVKCDTQDRKDSFKVHAPEYYHDYEVGSKVLVADNDVFQDGFKIKEKIDELNFKVEKDGQEDKDVKVSKIRKDGEYETGDLVHVKLFFENCGFEDGYKITEVLGKGLYEVKNEDKKATIEAQYIKRSDTIYVVKGKFTGEHKKVFQKGDELIYIRETTSQVRVQHAKDAKEYKIAKDDWITKDKVEDNKKETIKPKGLEKDDIVQIRRFIAAGSDKLNAIVDKIEGSKLHLKVLNKKKEPTDEKTHWVRNLQTEEDLKNKWGMVAVKRIFVLQKDVTSVPEKKPFQIDEKLKIKREEESNITVVQDELEYTISKDDKKNLEKEAPEAEAPDAAAAAAAAAKAKAEAEAAAAAASAPYKAGDKVKLHKTLTSNKYIKAKVVKVTGKGFKIKLEAVSPKDSKLYWVKNDLSLEKLEDDYKMKKVA